MKAIVFESFGGPEVMTLADVSTPEIAPGMVLVNNHAIGVNFSDTLMRAGGYGAPELPATPGSEASGEIVALGADVETGSGQFRLAPGMRVACVGSQTYAAMSLVPAGNVIPLPDSFSYEQGAAFPTQVLTAWHLLHSQHTTTQGQTVLVHSAAGGVGLAAVQIAKAAGARVIGTVSSADKARLVREVGADEAIDYATRDFAEDVLRLTAGRGADLILDAVGQPTLSKDLGCVAPMGHVVLYGTSGGPPDPVEVSTLFAHSAKLSCSFFVRTTSARTAGDRASTIRSSSSSNGSFVS